MTDDYGMRPVTPEKTCDNPAPHGEHEWIWDRILRRQCPGVGPVGYTCPHCNKTSHNPNDAREAYCSMCHHFCRDVAIGELFDHLEDREL